MLQLLEDEPPQYRVMITMLIFTGLRRGELCGLEWQDIDFEAKQITVERSCLCSREKGVFTDATKNEFSKRTLETSDLVFSLLYKHRTSQIEQKLLMGDRWRDCNRVFTAQDGNPFHPDTLTNWFRSFTKKNNLPDVHIHSMRHTHASFLIAQGIPITTVAKKLGHSNSYTLLSTYAHAVENGERVVAQTMDNILHLKGKGSV